MPAEFQVSIGGQCPVLGLGWLHQAHFALEVAHGLRLFFRARGDAWRCEIGSGPDVYGCPGDVIWVAWGWWGVWPDAGRMDPRVAEHLITMLVEAFQHYESGGDWTARLITSGLPHA